MSKGNWVKPSRILRIGRNAYALLGTSWREVISIKRGGYAILGRPVGGPELASIMGALATEDEPIPARIDKATQAATDAFWKAVAEAFPEATTGDIAPCDDRTFLETASSQIDQWVELNVPGEADRRWARRCVEAYHGEPVGKMEIVPDPNIRGMWAVRLDDGSEFLVDLILPEDGIEDENRVEDVEFTTWPPRAEGA